MSLQNFARTKSINQKKKNSDDISQWARKIKKAQAKKTREIKSIF